MGEASPIEGALRRLEEALGSLETVVDDRLQGAAQAENLENEVHRLGTDRSRLAQSLDAAEARSMRLETANREVSRRLVTAMESIRAVLDRHGH
jgi:chromosome segregation ATPase